MIQDAQDNAAKDAARREAIEARNEADSAINMLEKNLEEYKDQLEADQVEGLRKNIAETREIVAKEESTTEEIEKAVGDLKAASMKIYEMVAEANKAKGGDADGAKAD